MDIDPKLLKEILQRVAERAPYAHIQKPYVTARGCPADFEVQYQLLPLPEGGPRVVYQGLRSDFLYEDDNVNYWVWPEFLDHDGEVLMDKSKPVSGTGKALMWIGMHESRVGVHRMRIKIGTRGFMVGGSSRIASIVVTKIIGLHENE